MSHTVTVTRTTTTTTTSAIILNTGYFKTWPGILKFLELILGIVNVGLVAYYHRRNAYISYSTELLLFLLMATTFMIGTFLLLLSCLVSIATASILPKTIHEVIYHGFAFILYLIASLVLITEVSRHKDSYYRNDHEPFFAAAAIGLAVSVLYLLSTIFAWRSYKGL